MLNFIPRFAYYQRLSAHMVFYQYMRKSGKLLKGKIVSLKSFFQLIMFPSFPNGNDESQTIRKSPFSFYYALVCSAIMRDLNVRVILRGDVVHRWHTMEPWSMKFRRWIFREKNSPKQTLIEFYPTSQLKQSTQDSLKELYLKYESEMIFGISRKFLFEVYEELHLFQKDEERLGFYRQSGYYKKRNQKVASVHFAQFVKIFEDALKKLRKRKEPITESTFVEQFIEKCHEKSEQIKQWEQKIQKKRQDYVKLLPELQDQKNELIRQMLCDNPYIQENQIEEQLQNKGLYGLGTKDKLVIYDLQLTLHKLLLDSKKTKLIDSMTFGQSTLSSDKEKRVRQKIQYEEEQVRLLQEKRDEIAAKFKVLFKKQEIFDI